MDTLKVAAIQMTSTTKWQQNLDTAISLIQKATQAGAKLIVLPEFFIRVGESRDKDFLDIIEEIGIGKTQSKLKAVAKEYQIYLVAGTIPIKTKGNNKCYNTTIVYDPQGEMMCYYHKIHLFRFDGLEQKIDESDLFLSGEDIVTFNIDNFSFGLSICYDLRFPELFREMSGVDAIIIPAAFLKKTGEAHWEILLRARAIENQCYVIASAQTGLHENKRQTFGHSMIIDPWGIIKTTLKYGEGFIIHEMNKTTINKVRADLPALQHRKL
jgi:predicted amidohydrolase